MLKANYEQELKKAIAILYNVFEAYPLNTSMKGCPCCVTEGDLQIVTAKVLHKLTADDLNHFAFKAMTTWGTVEDFKHFLPRLLELLPFDENFFWSDIFIGKLAYANFNNWQKEEKKAINIYLLALGNYVLAQDPSFVIKPDDLIDGLMDITDDLDLYFIVWQNHPSLNSLINLSEFINREINFNSLPIEVSCLSSKNTQRFANWLTQKEILEKLEQSFFAHFDDLDKYGLGQMAIAIDILNYKTL